MGTRAKRGVRSPRRRGSYDGQGGGLVRGRTRMPPSTQSFQRALARRIPVGTTSGALDANPRARVSYRVGSQRTRLGGMLRAGPGVSHRLAPVSSSQYNRGHLSRSSPREGGHGMRPPRCRGSRVPGGVGPSCNGTGAFGLKNAPSTYGLLVVHFTQCRNEGFLYCLLLLLRLVFSARGPRLLRP